MLVEEDLLSLWLKPRHIASAVGILGTLLAEWCKIRFPGIIGAVFESY